MEVKDWSYEDFPELKDLPDGAELISTTGDELGVHLFADVEYAKLDGISLCLQILRPFNRKERFDPKTIYPCIIFVQGSGWMEQDMHEQIPLVSKLAERGYVVAMVQYRHSGQASFPSQIIDARNAARFMKKHAAEYMADPDRMIMMGDSSGGHTAVFAGFMNDDDESTNLFPGIKADVKGVIDVYGSVSVMLEDGNPTTINHHMPDSPEGMVMGGVNLIEHDDLRRKLSAECNITESTEIPPMLIVHGTKDRTVNAMNSVVLYEHMKKCGKEVEICFVGGGDHGGAEYWIDPVLDRYEKFIHKCLAD